MKTRGTVEAVEAVIAPTGTYSQALTVSGEPVVTGSVTRTVNEIDENILVVGAGSVSISESGSTITISGAAANVAGADHSTLANLDFASAGHTGFASTVELFATSGTLSAEIDSDIAVHGADASAHHSKYTDSETVLATESARFTTSGSLSSEIDSDIATHAAISSAHHSRYTDGEAVAATEAARFTMSGTLSAEIDSDIVTHAADASAHHARYTDAEAITALEPTTSALAASGVALGAELLTVSGNLQTQIDTNVTDITANTTLIVTTSGNLQSQIDAVEASDVDSVNAQTGAITVTGTNGVDSVTSGQTITLSADEAAIDHDALLNFTSTEHFTEASIDHTAIQNIGVNTHAQIDTNLAALAASGVATDANVVSVSGHLSTEIDTDIATHAAIAAAHHAKYTAAEAVADTESARFTMSGTLSAEIDSDISTHAAIAGAHHDKYTDAEAITALEPTTSALAASGVATDANIVAVSGHLSTEIDGDISTHAAISDAHHTRYTDGEAVTATESARFTMSGTLSAEIDSEISTHAAISNAHHDKYTDAEAITALEPTTSALAASGVATDTNIVSVSGHLQSEIDAVEGSDVDDVNSVLGSVIIAGAGEVVVTTAGQTITVSGTDHTAAAGPQEPDIDSINTVTGSLTLGGATGITIVDDTTDSDNPVITVSGNRDELLTVSGFLTDHRNLSGLTDDDHSQYALLAGRSSGQDLIGGTGASDELGLQGTSAADLGVVRLKSKLQLNAVQTDASPIDTLGGIIEMAETFTTTARLTFSLLANHSTWNADAGSETLFSPAMRIIEDTATINVDVLPGPFGTFSFAQISPTYNITDSAAQLPALFFAQYNPLLKSDTGTTTTSPGVTAFLFAPQLKTTVAPTIHEMTELTALKVQPAYSVASFSIVDFGDLTGIDFLGPRLGFLGDNTGVKKVNSATGLFMKEPTTGITLDGDWVALRSTVSGGSDRYVIRNEGEAQSTFGLGNVLFGTLDAEEVQFRWDGSSAFFMEQTGVTAVDFHIGANAILVSGTVGINQPAPTEQFHVVGSGIIEGDLTVSGSSGALRVDGTSAFSNVEINAAAGNALLITKASSHISLKGPTGSHNSIVQHVASGAAGANLRLEPKPESSSDKAQVSLLRGSDGSSNSNVAIYPADGTNTVVHQLAGRSSSFLASTGHLLAIGHNSPSEQLHVMGSGIVEGDFTVQEVSGASGALTVEGQTINFGNLPTASGALNSGDLWVDTGSDYTLKVTP